MLDKTQIITSEPEPVKQLTTQQVEENMGLIDDLKFFLATAPANWQKNQVLRRYYLNHEEGYISCIFWNNLYFMTGTDIVRCIVYRFEQFGREITDRKKFEEGIFSDLRSLKCGTDAVLEPSKSPFLEFLYKNSALRTQKKQKVFFWFSVPHDKLFADALERDLKKEQVDQAATTRAKQEPALSFKYNSNAPLHDQLLSYVNSQKNEICDQDSATITPNSIGTDFQDTPSAQQPLAESSSDMQQYTFVIKEEPETGTPVVTPGRLEDDFPLDYFPHSTEHEPMMIDPSVFIDPPEHFDDQFLIDQTYAKTPFYQTAFEPMDLKRNDSNATDDEDYIVPVSQLPSSTGVAYPGMPPIVQAAMVTGPRGYYYPQQIATGPQITNGQFYDHQVDGDNEYDYEYQDAPLYSYQPQLQPQPVYYPIQDPHQQAQYLAVQHPPPAYYGEADDGIEYHYDPQQQMQHHQQPIISPFGRVFPSFQATAPPQQLSPQHQQQRPMSAKSVRFPRSTTKQGKVMKPSSLRQQRSVASRDSQKMARELEKDGGEKVEEGQVEEGADTQGEGEYTTLPTPESTVPEHQHVNNSGAAGGIMNEYLEEEYEEK